MRCFLAVDLPEHLKGALLRIQSELRDLDAKLVEPQNLHFTVKFLGDIDVSGITEVSTRMNALALETAPVRVSLSGVGFFPNDRFVRVVWVGSPTAAFLDLHHAVHQKLSPLFAAEKPVPHLTLARIRSASFLAYLQAFGERHRNSDFGQFVADRILLKRSTVTREGPVYETITSFPLTGNQP